MRVLVVDDEPTIRELCRVNLEIAGHDVLLAAGGADAVELLGRERVDFVFLDLMMPEVDGWEVLTAIRESEEHATVPVVLLTARAGEDDQIRGWEMGIFDYMVKPFNPLSLSEWVDQAHDPAAGETSERRRRQALEQLRLLREMR